MKKSVLCFFFFLSFFAIGKAQTFTFECVCDHVSNDTCDICPIVPGLISRSFHGLLIRRNGTPYRWIDEPYTVKRYSNETIEFAELLPNPDKIIIARFQTQFTTMQGFADSTNCVCSSGGGGGGMSTVIVDTPMVGNGSIGSPVTIGQFGADTTMFLKWNGSYWYPAKIKLSNAVFNLPYYSGDAAAMTAGLSPGDAYLLECENDYSLPGGMFKVVKICGFDCSFIIRFYIDDAAAQLGGVFPGREYALTQANEYGLLYGFLKSVATDTLTTGTYVCSTNKPHYNNDAAAVLGGLAVGDIYNMTAANTYGTAYGMQRILSTTATTEGPPAVCCDPDETLPFYANDAAAIAGGLATNDYYFLSQTNTLGFPWGTKKRIQ